MHKLNISWIPLLIRKTTSLLFILACMVFITYIIGNFQEFLDSTQLILLNIFGYISVLFIILGFYQIIFILIDIIRFKIKRFINLGLIIFGEVIIIFLYVLVKMITVVTMTVS